MNGRDGIEMPEGVFLPSPEEDEEVLDAQATIARAITIGAAPVNQKFVAASMFLRLYLGREGGELADQALKFKARQAPGYMKRMTEALKALSAHELIKPFTLGQGGGK